MGRGGGSAQSSQVLGGVATRSRSLPADRTYLRSVLLLACFSLAQGNAKRREGAVCATRAIDRPAVLRDGVNAN